MFDMVHTALIIESIDRLLISSGIFQDKRKWVISNLNCTYCVFTLWAVLLHLCTCVMFVRSALIIVHRNVKTLNYLNVFICSTTQLKLKMYYFVYVTSLLNLIMNNLYIMHRFLSTGKIETFHYVVCTLANIFSQKLLKWLDRDTKATLYGYLRHFSWSYWRTPTQGRN